MMFSLAHRALGLLRWCSLGLSQATEIPGIASYIGARRLMLAELIAGEER